MASSRIDLSLPQLEAFVQVAASGSFRAAAAQIGVSQPAISRTIREAEHFCICPNCVIMWLVRLSVTTKH